MLLLVVAIATICLLAAHAVPYDSHSGLGFVPPGRIIQGVVDGSRQFGQQLGGGETYGRRHGSVVGGSNGYIDEGYERGGSHAHDEGHLEQDYSRVEEIRHVSSGHASDNDQYGSGGHHREGHGAFESHQGFGRRGSNELGLGI